MSLTLRRLNAIFAIGAGIGFFFVALGISSMVNFFTVRQVMRYSTDIMVTILLLVYFS
jgi:hypothetical protein